MSTVEAPIYFPHTTRQPEPEPDQYAGIPYDQLPHEVKKQRFVMPEIGVGDPIAFYNGADPMATPAFGHVTKVEKRTIHCLVFTEAGGRQHSSVFNINDPRLDDNMHLRAHGAWDYTTNHRKLLERLANLERAVLGDKKGNAEDNGKPEKAEPTDPIQAAYERMNRDELLAHCEEHAQGKVHPAPSWGKDAIIRNLMKHDIAPPSPETADTDNTDA